MDGATRHGKRQIPSLRTKNRLVPCGLLRMRADAHMYLARTSGPAQRVCQHRSASKIIKAIRVSCHMLCGISLVHHHVTRLTWPCSTAAAGCGWCYYENKCMAGTLGESSPIVMDVGADGITLEPPPPCKGEGNWSFGGGRCDCYKKCDACTENDCGT